MTLSFSSGNWVGQSEVVKYPALCNGNYQTNLANEISFQNTCSWTAKFDWALILSGTYKFKIIGKEIALSKDYNGALQDIYKLRKQ